MSDIFREVEQDLRRERYQVLWRKYGRYVIGGFIVLVLGAAIVAGAQNWTVSREEDTSRRYEEAVSSLSEEDTIEARAALAVVAKEGQGGYRILARLQEAAVLSKAGDWEGAVRLYDTLAADRSLSPSLRNAVRIKAALLLVDKIEEQQIVVRLEDIAQPGQPMRGNARELLGLAAFHAGRPTQARTYFIDIINDPDTSSGLLDRAHAMLTILAPEVDADQTVPDETPN